jgi:hypothetical protein
MQARKFWHLVSTGVLLLALLTLLAPSPAATQGLPPLRPGAATVSALCQFPAPSKGDVNVLNAVAAVPHYVKAMPAHKTMWAVGYSSPEGADVPGIATLTLYFNGKMWQRVPSPNLPGQNVLTGVAANIENDVWAVGDVYNGFEFDPLLMHFNGTAWKMWPVPLPEPVWVGPTDIHLTGITILGGYRTDLQPPQPAGTAVAVGYMEHMGSSHPFALYFNGDNWKLLPLPDTMLSGRFYAVAGDSLTDFWAVGTLEEDGQSVAYLFHHTALGWTPIAKGTGPLTSLAISGDRIFTVGHVTTFSGVETLAMAYTISNGEWSQIKTFYNVSGDKVLTGVTASNGNVYAVGYTLDPADDVTHQTLVLAYDGANFVPITSPSPDRTSELHGVAINAGMIWAVGTTGHGAYRSTLVLTNICNQ